MAPPPRGAKAPQCPCGKELLVAPCVINSQVCDRCRKCIRATYTHRCRPCDYDLCVRCFSRSEASSSPRSGSPPADGLAPAAPGAEVWPPQESAGRAGQVPSHRASGSSGAGHPGAHLPRVVRPRAQGAASAPLPSVVLPPSGSQSARAWREPPEPQEPNHSARGRRKQHKNLKLRHAYGAARPSTVPSEPASRFGGSRYLEEGRSYASEGTEHFPYPWLAEEEERRALGSPSSQQAIASAAEVMGTVNATNEENAERFRIAKAVLAAAHMPPREFAAKFPMERPTVSTRPLRPGTTAADYTSRFVYTRPTYC